MHRWPITAAVLTMLAASTCLAQSASWAVDPARPGPDAPPAGRSLFDFVMTKEQHGKRVYDIPFPFEGLVRRMEASSGCAPAERCAKLVLIPLGRSLQRTAAAPDFFKYPRVVVAIDAAHGAGPLLKDRVYLGYQEQANLIEVISYNEAAGRFEFQIVRDYRAGGTPQVIYARRAVCAACHQNLAPIFSRPLWEETNANARVAALLGRERAMFYGVPVTRGVDFPIAIDAATDRANQIGVWQRLWREGCGPNDAVGARCRAVAFTAALQYRLTGERVFDDRAGEWREGFLPAFAHEWRIRWPAGLAIPNPDLPNRDPLPPERAPQPRGVALAHVAAAFEPLAPRPPLEVWTIAQAETARRFIVGLAGFVAEADMRALDAHLAARATRERPRARRYEAPCEVAWTDEWLRFKCVPADEGSPHSARLAGRVELRAGRIIGGELDALAAGGAEPLHHLEAKGGALDANAGRLAFALASRGLRARLADGSAVAGIELRWRPGDARVRGRTHEVAARAIVGAADDFEPVRQAITALAADATEDGVFAARPFSRANVLSALFARLGLPRRDWCCDDASRLPPVAIEGDEPPIPADGPANPFAVFYPLCASCHATSERFPPNFLAGTSERVTASIKQCAPRIYTRLALWRIEPVARDKTPMPPPFPSVSATDYRAPAGVDGLERTIAELIRAEQGSAPDIQQLLARGYEALRPCLLEER